MGLIVDLENGTCNNSICFICMVCNYRVWQNYRVCAIKMNVRSPMRIIIHLTLTKPGNPWLLRNGTIFFFAVLSATELKVGFAGYRFVVSGMPDYSIFQQNIFWVL